MSPTLGLSATQHSRPLPWWVWCRWPSVSSSGRELWRTLPQPSFLQKCAPTPIQTGCPPNIEWLPSGMDPGRKGTPRAGIESNHHNWPHTINGRKVIAQLPCLTSCEIWIVQLQMELDMQVRVPSQLASYNSCYWSTPVQHLNHQRLRTCILHAHSSMAKKPR